MIILGVDPGTRVTGFGVVELEGSSCRCLEYGAISPGAAGGLARRLATIHSGLCDVVRRHAPDAAAVEGVFHAVNVRSALTLGHARGAVLLALAQHDVAVSEYSPMEIKKAVVGYGRAEKQQVQTMVQRILGLTSPPSPHDAADALAAALCLALGGRGPTASKGSWRKYKAVS